MTRYITIILSVVMLFQNSFHAQNLGYMGKKLSIDIGASVSPSFAKMRLYYPSSYYDSASKKTKEFRSVSLRVYPEVNISYAIGRRIEIAGRFGYQRYKLNYENFLLSSNQTDTIYNWNPDSFYINSSGNSSSFVKNTPISTSQSILAEISLRYYLKSYIAPVGNYLTFGYGVYLSKLTEGDTIYGKLQTSSSYTAVSGAEYKIENTWNPMRRITFGYHSKKVYGKSIYSDIGIEMSFSIKGKYQYNRSKMTAESYLQYGYIGNLQRRYLIWENLATIKFAVGKIF